MQSSKLWFKASRGDFNLKIYENPKELKIKWLEDKLECEIYEIGFTEQKSGYTERVSWKAFESFKSSSNKPQLIVMGNRINEVSAWLLFLLGKSRNLEQWGVQATRAKL